MLYWPMLFVFHVLLGAMFSLAAPIDPYQVRGLSSMDPNALASRSIGLHVPIARSDDACDIQRRCTREDKLDAPVPVVEQKTASPKHTLEKRSKAGNFFKKVGNWFKHNWEKVVEVGAKVVGTIAKAA